MSIKSIIQNELVEDKSSVWLLKDHSAFDYSEGAAAEKYLEKVFNAASDLSSQSSELESYIRDWSSEYHLTTKRAQLLSGFSFDRSLNVLEVGCGCGAITRHLGESFDSVLSIEGSLSRARLAKLRTRDLPSVSVVCAPFQEIRFSRKFDVIFVIGVYEYSASFVEGDAPYDDVLKHFAEILAPDGMVVMAIENQFGLKYFNAFREDHLGVPFEGLEGYHRRKPSVRTFGKVELEEQIRRYFQDVRFFYPYPDYKIPDCVLSPEFLQSERAGELVSQMKSRDYAGAVEPLWAESATALELARNGALEFFANSFLVVAGRTELRGVDFDQLAIIYSSSRRSVFATQTRIVRQPDQSWTVSKRSRQGLSVVEGGAIKLVNTDMPWLSELSLQTRVRLRSMSDDLTLKEIFAPCQSWIDFLAGEAVLESGVKMLTGSHVDSIWQNVYVEAGNPQIVDREWIWHEHIPLNVIIIRGIYHFLVGTATTPGVGKALHPRSGRTLIDRIAAVLGQQLRPEDFDAFIELEVEIQHIVFRTDKGRQRAYLRWFLADRASLNLFLRAKEKVVPILGRIRARFT
ncbi:MAG: class I SAM-dependent methyltransferase [Bradyrhizobium sp.]|uniref:class I SAM-dependent methyltransferase n=1 Tax=Bradyrhizobium sp. TaxID=376 RepID=UPI002731912F|nr:class I SAM-dependent methyltransferase [Bradyrhizobium sp.]MDP1867811.1 class I SAM-dependent methyltransferase [Bradyrhizobium sp.]